MFIPITLKNTSDLALFRVGFLEKEKIREIRVDAIVKDNWKCRLVISKQLQDFLDLPTKVTKTIFFDETSEYFVEMSEAVEFEIGNRRTTICPFVMADLQIPVIGSVLLGELNLEISFDQNLTFLERRIKI